MAEITLTNENRPVTFSLPDGDSVALVPWAYVIDRLTANLDKSVDLMQNINDALTLIDHKLTTWVDGSSDVTLPESVVTTAPDELFGTVYQNMYKQKLLVESIANKISVLDSIGQKSDATLQDYESNKRYIRNTLLVDRVTETVYRVTASQYNSVTVEQDCANGNLKLVGFESQIVTFDHTPTQSEINQLPDDALVAVYSSSADPLIPSAQGE